MESNRFLSATLTCPVTLLAVFALQLQHVSVNQSSVSEIPALLFCASVFLKAACTQHFQNTRGVWKDASNRSGRFKHHYSSEMEIFFFLNRTIFFSNLIWPFRASIDFRKSRCRSYAVSKCDNASSGPLSVSVFTYKHSVVV